MSMFGVSTKLMKNDVVVVKLWMNSWLNVVVVVVVMGCVVDELMHWVFIFLDWWWKFDCCWRFWWNLLDCWIMMKWCFDFKFCVTLSALLCSYTCKQLLGRVWVFGRSKFGILGEKGLEPVTFLTELMNGRLSELQASSHSSFCDLVAWASSWSFKRAVPSSALLCFFVLGTWGPIRAF